MRNLLKLILTLSFAPLFVTCLYDSSSQVKVINGSQLKKLVKENPVVIVEFFAEWCGHCKAFAPEYEKAAKALKGIVPVVAIDDQSDMAEYGIQGFPTVKVFTEHSVKPKDFTGPRKAESVLNAALSALKDVTNSRLSGKTSGNKGSNKTKESSKKSRKSSVVELTDSNFDDLVIKDKENSWFVKFYAPWCGHCKSLAPDWEELGSMADGRVKIAKLDATQHTMMAHRYKIQGFPTLLMFPAGEKREITPVNYNGPRTANDLFEFAIKFQSSSASIKQMISQEVFENTCTKGLCVIAFLPHIADSSDSEREKYLKIYKDVVSASAAMTIRFLWSEGGSQFDFEEKLNLAFGYPAVVAINNEKQRFSTHRGSFTVESLNSFIIALTTGRAPVDPLPKLPKISKVSSWEPKKSKENSHAEENRNKSNRQSDEL
ncbi:Thioredoxin [Cryptosporidium hominis]|uniref:protein disulfide-isomerase n=1 Tax=Cryptosporidium hominis TaxID=237895 RepID=A0ABX5BEK9_CRYHO|nr:protein disulfide isomerase-related protein (provisional) [Cryptosporidium hominis TU502]PPS95715.1 Thioredoxin [Cryptosporidium hominis]|eukprot:PPS95715.1 Thioredoxin [Cryptosporidium hominis]